MNTESAQMRLFPDTFARCDNCGRDVRRVVRVRRWRLCEHCRAEILPGGSGDRAAVERFWDWVYRMEQRDPTPISTAPVRRTEAVRSVESYWPFCECGALRPASSLNLSPQLSIFGPARVGKCRRCEARSTVESVVRLADTLHPDWGDEDWLDLLYRSHRGAFEIGVLPDYWFELRRRAWLDGCGVMQRCL